MKAIDPRLPVDRVAARVVSAGVEPPRDPLMMGEQALPHTAAPPPKAASWRDRVGEVHGRLTVVGWAGGARWSCRCDCGRYVLRTSAYLRRGRPCSACIRIEAGYQPDPPCAQQAWVRHLEVFIGLPEPVTLAAYARALRVGKNHARERAQTLALLGLIRPCGGGRWERAGQTTVADFSHLRG